MREPNLLESMLMVAAILVVAYGAAVLILSLEKCATPRASAGISSSPGRDGPAVAALSHPLTCDATIAQRSAGKWDGPRCYMTKATKEVR